MWKDIEGYEGIYQISDSGEVKSLNYKRTGKEGLRALRKDKDGYIIVDLLKENKSTTYKVHRLVAQAFLPNPDALPEVNHKDEDKTNNTVDNLEWCDRSYNINYGTAKDRAASKRSKTVLQYDLAGNFIAEFKSTREVERILGINQVSVSQCCRGQIKKSHGFIWKYNQ